MVKWGGFRGQRPRPCTMLTETMYQNESGVHGMQPTRGAPRWRAEIQKNFLANFRLRRTSQFPYDPQLVYRDYVFSGPQKIPAALHEGEAAQRLQERGVPDHGLGDDAAYSLNDIVDGVKPAS